MLPATQRIGTLGSAGQLIPGIVARVVKEDGSLAKEGEQGELVIKGPSMALCYMNNEAASKETFVDGWVRTGDEVIFKNGDIYIVDRLKEIMKVRGFQVAPAELEGHLLSHVDVADACVVSIPDDYSGELPFAYIVLTEAAARRITGNAEATAHMKSALAKYVADAKVHYKHLAGGIEFIDAIPKNPSGKIVHQQVSRLMRGNFIKEQPVWYQAVLDFPPLPLPPRAPPARTQYDQVANASQPTHPEAHNQKPLRIAYIEDKIRRQFFRDHPFETFRPTTLVEGAVIEDAHPIRGEAWTRLRQRGRHPTPEDTISFARNLHEKHEKPLSEAYETAVAQFRALRSEHQIATTFAAMEADYLGAIFSKGEIEHAFDKEKRGLATFERLEEFDEGAIAARKRWKAIVDRTEGVTEWTKGKEYAKLWKEGVRPTYAPQLTKPIEPERGASPDIMHLMPRAVSA
ncbi:hypothetical protein C0991_009233 [Blastosporella zonata]|nr:hypothetical protein C0991_009233 [Blastosporella zonata]